MTRFLGLFAALFGLCAMLTTAPAGGQQTLILPGKWNVEQYKANPNYLQVLIDMRAVHSKIRVQGIRGTATLYATPTKYIRTAVLTIPAGELSSGKVYVHYVPSGVSRVVKLYPISASAKTAVYPPGVNPMPGQPLQTEVKVYPAVPLRYEKKLKITGIPAAQLKALSAKPPRR
jgi:hypothetical protein